MTEQSFASPQFFSCCLEKNRFCFLGLVRGAIGKTHYSN